MRYHVNGIELGYEVEGPVVRGDNSITLESDQDLTDLTSWGSIGYSIEPLFDNDAFIQFKSKTRDLLLKCWRQANLKIDESFALSDYHRVADTWEKHLAAVEFTKLLPVEDFPVPIMLLETRISSILNRDVVVRNLYDNQSIFHFRVIRPGSKDNNPLHRDVWLPDYKDCINLYIPIAGSNERSSLIIAPGSHRWPESLVERTSTGATINGIKFNVPAVSQILTEADFIRPNPSENEVLVFSPYLIHGGSSNLNLDQTRISIEIRLWAK